MEIRPDGSVRHDGDWDNDRPIRDPPAASSIDITTSIGTISDIVVDNTTVETAVNNDNDEKDGVGEIVQL